MAISILLIIAFWFMYNAGIIPLALAICMTVFGSLSCLFKLIRGIARVCKENDYDESDSIVRQFLPKYRK